MSSDSAFNNTQLLAPSMTGGKFGLGKVVDRIKQSNSGQFTRLTGAECTVDFPPAPKIPNSKEWERYKLLAETAERERNPAQAEKWWLSALMEANRFGQADPRLAQTLESLGNLYVLMSRFQQAELFMRRAVDANTFIYGSFDIRVSACLNSLGAILYAQRRFDDAKAVCFRLLRIYQSVYEPDHPDVGMAAGNLAMVLHALGDSQAEQLYQKALSIRTRALGPTNPHVTLLRNNYYDLLVAMNRKADAQALLCPKQNLTTNGVLGNGTEVALSEITIGPY